MCQGIFQLRHIICSGIVGQAVGSMLFRRIYKFLISGKHLGTASLYFGFNGVIFLFTDSARRRNAYIIGQTLIAHVGFRIIVSENNLAIIIFRLKPKQRTATVDGPHTDIVHKDRSDIGRRIRKRSHVVDILHEFTGAEIVEEI